MNINKIFILNVNHLLIGNFKISNTIDVVATIFLLSIVISYGYFYFSSTQILYKDGIKLMYNKFITKDGIEDIFYRDTFIRKGKVFEINTKDGSLGFRKKVNIGCKSEEEFLKTLIYLEELTGLPIKSL